MTPIQKPKTILWCLLTNKKIKRKKENTSLLIYAIILRLISVEGVLWELRQHYKEQTNAVRVNEVLNKGRSGTMRKVVKINEKEYSMKSSAYTQFKYKNDTGRGLLEDLNKIQKFQNLNADEQVEKTEELIELLLRLAYIMIEEADEKQVKSFEDFLKDVDGLLDDTDWINDVVVLASAPFSRGNLQKVPTQS